MINSKSPPLTTEPEVGYYRARLARKGPWVPIRIMQEQGLWVCLIAGRATADSGQSDPFQIAWLLYNWPLHPVTHLEYLALSAAHEDAKSGHPLADPSEAVNLREAPSLW